MKKFISNKFITPRGARERIRIKQEKIKIIILTRSGLEPKPKANETFVLYHYTISPIRRFK